MTISLRECILGYESTHDDQVESEMLNTVMLYLKYHIYSCKIKEKIPSVNCFAKQLRSQIEVWRVFSNAESIEILSNFASTL